MNTKSDRRRRIKGLPLVVGALSVATMLGACSASSPTPDQMARSTADTAPADLQLLCASAAGGGNALPVTSRKIDATTYQVDLSVSGSTSRCVIDAQGNVLSIQPDTG